MKHDRSPSLGTSAPASAPRLSNPGRVIIGKLDRPVMSFRVDLIPFPVLEVDKLGLLPRPMERDFVRDHAYVGLHLIREFTLAVSIVADGTDKRTWEVDSQAAVPGLKCDLERLVVQTADLHGGDTWIRQTRSRE